MAVSWAVNIHEAQVSQKSRNYFKHMISNGIYIPWHFLATNAENPYIY